MGFLYKNLAGGQVEVTPADDESFSEDEEDRVERETERKRKEDLARKPVEYDLADPSSSSTRPVEVNQVKIAIGKPTEKILEGVIEDSQVSNASKTREKAPAKSMAMGPKNKLMQLPKHKAQDEDEGSFDFDKED